jgi:hypothetical protein
LSIVAELRLGQVGLVLVSPADISLIGSDRGQGNRKGGSLSNSGTLGNDFAMHGLDQVPHDRQA